MTEITDQRGEKAEVKKGGEDMGIREWGLPAIYSSFMASRHRNLHAMTHVKKILTYKEETHLYLSLLIHSVSVQRVFCGFSLNEGGIF